jgi:hypothetical protein
LNLKKDDFIMILLAVIMALVAYLIFAAPTHQVVPPPPPTLGASSSSSASSAAGNIPSQFADKLITNSTSGAQSPNQQGTTVPGQPSPGMGGNLPKSIPPPEKGQVSFYDEAQKAVVKLENDPKFNLNAAQCAQFLDLMKKVEGARDIAPKTQKAIKTSLTPEQAAAVEKVKAPTQSAKTLEALVAELLAGLKAKQ